MLDRPNISISPHQETVSQWQRLLRYSSHRLPQTDNPPTQEYPHNNFSWGDTIYDKSDDTTRFYFQNIHGLQYNAKGGKLSEICHLMQSAQVDCAGLTEINTDLLQYPI